MDVINWTTLSTSDWIWFGFSALIIGIAKAGVKGLGMLVIPLLAIVFGGKPSVGLLLPMLSMADIMAVIYYNRDAEWKYVGLLIPSAVIGVLLGVWLGVYINDTAFTYFLAGIILFSLAFIIWQERRPLPPEVMTSPIVSNFTGLLGGFSTMIANAAGPIMAVYLLSIRLPKIKFIGTAAWFFLIINLFKIPFHVFSWKSITMDTFILNGMVFPIILLGFLIGVQIIKWIPEKLFRYLVLIVTAVAAIRLLL